MDRRKKEGALHEVTLAYLGGKRKLPLLKEEVWRTTAGVITRYSLAYIDPELFAGDNGRVLGYHNAHGHHHKHLKGIETSFRFTTYEELTKRFEREVRQLRRLK